jgi:hypothetical protein
MPPPSSGMKSTAGKEPADSKLSSETSVVLNRLHGVISHNTELFTIAAARMSKPIIEKVTRH